MIKANCMEALEGSDKANKEKQDGDRGQNDCEKPSKRKQDECNDPPQTKEHVKLALHPRENRHNMISYGDLEQCWLDEGCGTPNVKSSASQKLRKINKETKQQKCKANRKNPAKKQNARGKNDSSQTTGSKKGYRKKKENKKKEKVVRIKAPTVPCKYYLEGRCSKDTECTFAHAVQPSRKRELCKFYATGFCVKGGSCLYMHDEFPCKFFHTNTTCFSEPNCRFSHADLTPETKELLVKYLEFKNDQAQENGENSKNESPHREQQTFNPLPCHIEESREKAQASQVQQQTNGSGTDTGSQDPPPSPCLVWNPNFYVDTLVQPTATNPSSMPVIPENQSHINSNPPTSQLITTTGSHKNYENTDQNLQNDETNIDREAAVENKFQRTRVSRLQESMIDNSGNTKSYTTGLFVKERTDAKSVSNSTKTEEQGNSEKGIESDLQNDKEEISEGSGSTGVTCSASEFKAVRNKRATTKLPLAPTQFPGESCLRVQQQKLADGGTDVFKVPGCKRREQNETTCNSNKYSNKHLPPSMVHRKKELEWSMPNTSQRYRASHTLSTSIDAAKTVAETRQQVLQKSLALSRASIDVGKMLREIRQQIMPKSSVVESNTSQQKDFWKNLLSGASATIKDTCSNITTDAQLQNHSDLFNRSCTSSADPIVSKPLSPINERCQRYNTLTSRDPDVSLTNSPSTDTVESSSAQLPLLPSGDDSSVGLTTEKPKSAVENTNVPYKLHCIATTRPNYSSYAFADPSNSKLLNDPRLQEYFKRQRLAVTSGQRLESQFEKETKAHIGNDSAEHNLSLSEFWDWLKNTKSY